MRLDLSPLLAPIGRQGAGSRYAIDIDAEALAADLAGAAAAAMGRNLELGVRPDGSGSMPGRKRDGIPRGRGSKIAQHIAAERLAPLTYVIAAHRERPGHLARILQEVPLRPPPLPAETIRQALERSRKVVR